MGRLSGTTGSQRSFQQVQTFFGAFTMICRTGLHHNVTLLLQCPSSLTVSTKYLYKSVHMITLFVHI